MNHLKTTLAGIALLLSSTAFAAEPVSMDKVKKGLLSATETYTIYTVACSNERETAVAAMNRDTRWCVADNAELSCFSSRDSAAAKACSSTMLAAND